MATANYKELLEAGCHFGHLTRKWNPNMAPYIFMEKNGIHILDLQKTAVKMDEAGAALKQIAKSGRKILFVMTFLCTGLVYIELNHMAFHNFTRILIRIIQKIVCSTGA